MASMSIEKDQWHLYNSIINLSKMFHYNQKRNYEFVKLKEEIEYINSYLELQKDRYGDSLNIIYEIDKKILDVVVPFNFLQPIVENVFEHSANTSCKQMIKIVVRENYNNYIIKVLNHNSKLLKEDLIKINNDMKSGSSHGLSMVYNKLQNTYGNNFIMKIDRINDITEVKMNLPFLTEVGE